MRAPTFSDVMCVGMHFREREGVPAYMWAEEVQPGTQLDFAREPDNKFSAAAIKILHNDQHVAYIEDGQAVFISTYIDQGILYSCTVTDKINRERGGLTPIVKFVPTEVPLTESEVDESSPTDADLMYEEA